MALPPNWGKRCESNVMIEALSLAQVAMVILILVLLLREERLVVGRVPA
jgi:hypothetical protein